MYTELNGAIFTFNAKDRNSLVIESLVFACGDQFE